MYIFKKEIDAPAWLWDTNCIEQSSVWADSNEFRFILDMRNEVRVISGEEKRAGCLLSFHVYSDSCLARCRFGKLWPCHLSWEADRDLPPCQLCLGTLSSQSPHGLLYPIEPTLSLKSKQLHSCPEWYSSRLQPLNPQQSLAFFQCDGQCPVIAVFSLLELLQHRLWSMAVNTCW